MFQVVNQYDILNTTKLFKETEVFKVLLNQREFRQAQY